jgi:hypothetical protein
VKSRSQENVPENSANSSNHGARESEAESPIRRQAYHWRSGSWMRNLLGGDDDGRSRLERGTTFRTGDAQTMPLFACPQCGKNYLVPLAFCESFLANTPMQAREGSESAYVAVCSDCVSQTRTLLSSSPTGLPSERVEDARGKKGRAH